MRALALSLFALSLTASSACVRDGGPVEITVTKSGFEPPTVHARAGTPLTLVVTRKVNDTCATELVLRDENLRVPLPLGQPVTITFTPKKAGILRYSCGMGMLFGDIDVR